MTNKKNLAGGVLSVALAEIIGFLPMLFGGDIKALYNALPHPPFSPPEWVFPMMWAVLYAFIGAAAYMIFTGRPSGLRRTALVLYGLQLIVNILWSVAFFKCSAILMSVIMINLLVILTAITAVLFYKLRPLAGKLMIVYIIWLIYAAYLNIGMYAMYS